MMAGDILRCSLSSSEEQQPFNMRWSRAIFSMKSFIVSLTSASGKIRLETWVPKMREDNSRLFSHDNVPSP